MTTAKNEKQDHDKALSSLQPLPLTETLKGKRIIVIGGTGFLGKVWVSLLLTNFPDIGHLYLLVRAKKNLSSEQRFWKEIMTSHAFAPLFEKFPVEEELKAFVRKKVTPISGDVSLPLSGFSDELIDGLVGKIDAVVNVAGVVDFNPPLDEAIKVNCFGVQHLIQLCKALGDVPIMHTSTCFVAGNRDGLILEEDPRLRPFPRCGEIDLKHWDPEREIEEGFRLAERANHEANEAFRESEFLEKAKENLQRRGESCRGEVLADELEKVRRQYVNDFLSTKGMKRAEYWGWTNTYTYTKSIGEQLLLNSGLPATIVRPAIVESSIEYPMVGWNEGINTSAPLIYIILHGGAVGVPGSWDCNLDLIPNDMVCSGMIASLGALLEGSHKPVYQYGTSDLNPITTGRLQELIGLYKRRSRRKNPKGNLFFNKLQSMYSSRAVSADYFRKYGEPMYADTAVKLSKWTKKASLLPGLGFLKETSKTLSGAARQFNNMTNIYETFMPFMHDRRYRFDCSNTRELFERMSPEDRDKLVWYPETMDWRYWTMDVHIPGLEKWVTPLIKDRLRKKKKKLRAFPDLISMIYEVAEDNPFGICMQQLVDGRLETMIYKDFVAGIETIAALLQKEGLTKGDKVFIAGGNGPMWGISYFATLRAGGIAIPLDPELGEERLKNFARSSEARFALWDQDFLEEYGHLLVDINKEFSFQTFESMEERIDTTKEEAAPVEISSDDVASLIFTSGTTGEPKGVMLTHKNFTSLLSSLLPVFSLDSEDVSLSLLPLHHTFEFTCGLLLPLSRGVRITYLDELSGEKVVAALQEAKVTVLVGVPALWQLLGRRVRSEVKSKGKFVESFFNVLLDLNRNIGKTTGMDLGRLFFAPVHRQFGGHLRYLISGGAALPKETQKLFAGLGLHMAEGYGLTEAAPVLTVAKASPKSKLGHVGHAVPGVEIKIDSPNDEGIGEVLARGENVMLGYMNNPEATKKVITEDGWLKTGDLGKIDYKGRLFLVGRAKDVIVTMSGENVYPDDIEDLIGLPDSVSELVIVGLPDPNGDEQVALLAVPKEDDDKAFELRVLEARESLQKRMDKLSRHSRPTIVHFRDESLPRTATRKVKRNEAKEILIALEESFMNEDSGEEAKKLSSYVINAVTKITGASDDEVRKAKRLAVELGIDSLLMNELHLELERSLGQKIPVARLASCESVQAIQRLLEDVTNERLLVEDGLSWKEADKEDKELIEPPEFVKDSVKSALSSIQRSFYERMMKVKVFGRANIPYNRNTIIVANHSSHLDMGLVKYALGDYGEDIVTIGAKDYFFEKDQYRKYFFENFTNVVPFERGAGFEESFREIRNALKMGKTILIFPEGTRGSTGFISSFRAGVGYLSLEHQVDILPIFIDGSFKSMPKGRPIPTRRKLKVRIGRVLSFDTMQEKVKELSSHEAAREIALMAENAVLSLRDKKMFDLKHYELSEQEKQEEPETLSDLLDYLQGRYDPDAVEEPVTFYFSLGQKPSEKWSLVVDKDSCRAHVGKPEGGFADCVLKTSPEIFRQIVKDAYIPDPELFLSGVIKSSNIPLLQQLSMIFHLQDV